MPKGVRYSPEFREEAVRKVVDERRTITAVARELEISKHTLGEWARKYKNDSREPLAGDASIASVDDESKKTRQLERENRELRAEVEFLKKASAYFAQLQHQRRNTSS